VCLVGLTWVVVWCYYLVVVKGEGRDMNDKTVESTLFIYIATSDYGVVHNGILIMDGQDIYRVHQYHIVFEQGTLNITPVCDGTVCAYTMTDNEGVTNEIGVLESYDDFIDLFNGCIMSFGGVIR